MVHWRNVKSKTSTVFSPPSRTKGGDILPPITINCLDVTATAGLARLVGMGGRISSHTLTGVRPTRVFVVVASVFFFPTYPPTATSFSWTIAMAKQLCVHSGSMIHLLVLSV